MTNNLSINALKEQFKAECKVINLAYEYSDYAGDVKYGIITELSEEELWLKYSELMKSYVPYVLLPAECRKVLQAYKQNEDKHGKRAVNNTDCYGYEDDTSQRFHPELCCYDKTKEDEAEERRQEDSRNLQLSLLEEAMAELTEVQKRRLRAAYIDGKTRREIAQEEGVNYSKIDKSIMQALKKMKVFYENRGCKSLFHSE